MRELTGHRAGQAVTSLAFSPDGGTLASAGGDVCVLWWDLTTGTSRPLAGGCWDAGLGFLPDGRLVAACRDAVLRVYGADAQPLQALRTHLVGPATACSSPDGKVLGVLCHHRKRGRVTLWDTTTWMPLPRWSGTAHDCLAFHPRERLLIIGKHRSLHAREHRPPEPILMRVDPEWEEKPPWIRGHPTQAARLAFHPDGHLLAGVCGSWLHVWEVETGRMAFTHESGPDYTTVAFTPEGRQLIAGHKDETVRIWDTAGWTLLAARDWRVGPVTALAVSPDGMRAAAGGKGGKIVLWDLDD